MLLTPVQQRYFRALLVGDGENFLELAVTVTEFVPTPLFRLDPLSTNFLATLGNNTDR